ncbi:DUF2975 domain-containing protein [Frigoriflavimonas asaccharolytica]|uniref:DUF2975 family protein n=1 Tax=Frigoriflavimonas asaccharolytica TaxID=2735899 RepID=A0A8J8K6M6_9FLAO|nr:DUF2975 domain-containing protein [Frigoriflavimonas asaccharolytica]NRS93915.1 hypothetical protein [Frigoriflavimonas asaccharolytica]
MKLIGKNSVSFYLSYLFLTISVFFILHLVYQGLGHLLLYYKHESGSNLFPNAFQLGNDVGWSKNKYTEPMNDLLKFKMNYPFTETQMVTGIYGNINQIISNLFGFLFGGAFFYISFKSFKEMGSDKLFNSNAIKWLKMFAYLNLAYAMIALCQMFMFYGVDGFAIISIFAFTFLGIIVLFIVQFFKKGYELQSQSDLTI